MKKRALLAVVCLGLALLTACGKKRETDLQSITSMEEIPKFGLTRDEVIEKYFTPMKEVKKEYNEARTVDDIERLAREYNNLAVEGRLAYLEAVGRPEVSFIARGRYLLRAAYYTVVEDLVTGYGKIEGYTHYGVSYACEGINNEKGEWIPIKVYTEDEQLITVNPEASDAIVVLINKESINGSSCVMNFKLIREGGRSTLDINVSDYTDRRIDDIKVHGDNILLSTSKKIGDFLWYKDVGDKLEFYKECFDFEPLPDYPNDVYGYKDRRIDGEVEKDFFSDLDVFSLVTQE